LDGGISLRVFEAGFPELKGFWQGADTGLFTSFEWLFLWHKHVADARPRLLALSSGKKVVALLPLALARRKILVSEASVLELLGQEYSYHLGIVFAKGLSNAIKQECASAFARHLLETRNWDYIHFRHLKDESLLAKALEKEAAAVKGLSFREAEPEPCFVLAIPESREKYFDSLEKSMRKKFRRDLRRIEKDFEVETVLGGDPEKDWPLFLKLHLENMERKDQATVLEKSSFQGFFRAVAEKRRGVFVKLFLDKRLSGVLFGIVENRVFYFVNVGYAKGLEKYSLGNVMVLKSIDYCFENGCLFFDMLAGGEGYKKHFGTKEYDGFQAIVAPGSKLAERDLKRKLKGIVSGGKNG
jgi:CelD/BcsL family acetyltransferase involved in cellulose biosynthesis